MNMTPEELKKLYEKDTGKDAIDILSYMDWLEKKLCKSSPVIIHGRKDILVTTQKDPSK